MSMKKELVGKTISGVVAAPGAEGQPCRIWMLQFTDGTHVEFVSPAAQRRLRRLASAPQLPFEQALGNPQLALNVA